MKISRNVLKSFLAFALISIFPGIAWSSFNIPTRNTFDPHQVAKTQLCEKAFIDPAFANSSNCIEAINDCAESLGDLLLETIQTYNIFYPSSFLFQIGDTTISTTYSLYSSIVDQKFIQQHQHATISELDNTLLWGSYSIGYLSSIQSDCTNSSNVIGSPSSPSDPIVQYPGVVIQPSDEPQGELPIFTPTPDGDPTIGPDTPVIDLPESGTQDEPTSPLPDGEPSSDPSQDSEDDPLGHEEGDNESPTGPSAGNEEDETEDSTVSGEATPGEPQNGNPGSTRPNDDSELYPEISDSDGTTEAAGGSSNVGISSPIPVKPTPPFEDDPEDVTNTSSLHSPTDNTSTDPSSNGGAGGGCSLGMATSASSMGGVLVILAGLFPLVGRRYLK